MVMPDLGGDPAISTIRFERVVGVDTMPWPARRYGDVVTPLVAYFECYVHSPSGQRVRTRLWSLDDERVVWELWLGPLAVERSPYRLTIPADSIMNGSYELQASIEDSAGHVLASSAETLIIQNPHRLTRRDYQDRVDQLRYISRTHELDFLKQAPDSLRDSLWQQFWKGRDPTPGTDRNEAQDEYYERISFANQHYSVGIRPGWRTDMGQIYIRYGAPDEIERHPFDTDIPAYEIWYYYRDGHKFIFSDVQGFGEYRLTHPRNEKMR
jgi:GWxTD domain-containing protein